MLTQRQKEALTLWYLDQLDDWTKQVFLSVLLFFVARRKPRFAW